MSLRNQSETVLQSSFTSGFGNDKSCTLEMAHLIEHQPDAMKGWTLCRVRYLCAAKTMYTPHVAGLVAPKARFAYTHETSWIIRTNYQPMKFIALEDHTGKLPHFVVDYYGMIA
jgi:hypothetical protein